MINNYRITSLAHVRALVTRPLPQGKRLADLICAHGGTAELFPIFDIIYLLDTSENSVFAEGLVASFDRADAVIFTSVHAVMPLKGLSFHKAHLPPCYAIGSATAAALTDLGFDAVRFPAHGLFSSEALLAMPAFSQVRAQRMLIIAGENARPYLSRTLKDRGAMVESIEVYRRELSQADTHAHLSDWQAGGIHVVIATSCSGLQGLFDRFDSPQARWWLLSRTLLVTSESMVVLAAQLRFRDVIQAKNATDQSVLLALQGNHDGKYTTEASSSNSRTSR